MTSQNTTSTNITLWATFGGRLQISAIKPWTPATDATGVKSTDFRPGMDPCSHCRDAPIDVGNTHYDRRSKSWLMSGPGNHRFKVCPAAPAVESADAWRPRMGPCYHCRNAPIDVRNTCYDERSKTWLTSGPGNHMGRHCTGIDRRPGVDPFCSAVPIDIDMDYRFMHHKANAQIRDLRAEIKGVQESGELQLKQRTACTADNAGHLIVGVISITSSR